MHKRKDDVSADDLHRESSSLDASKRRALELFERLVELEKEKDKIRTELAELLGLALSPTKNKEV
jgi:hypothetical protein